MPAPVVAAAAGGAGGATAAAGSGAGASSSAAASTSSQSASGMKSGSQANQAQDGIDISDYLNGGCQTNSCHQSDGDQYVRQEQQRKLIESFQVPGQETDGVNPFATMSPHALHGGSLNIDVTFNESREHKEAVTSMDRAKQEEARPPDPNSAPQPQLATHASRDAQDHATETGTGLRNTEASELGQSSGDTQRNRASSSIRETPTAPERTQEEAAQQEAPDTLKDAPPEPDGQRPARRAKEDPEEEDHSSTAQEKVEAFTGGFATNALEVMADTVEFFGDLGFGYVPDEDREEAIQQFREFDEAGFGIAARKDPDFAAAGGYSARLIIENVSPSSKAKAATRTADLSFEAFKKGVHAYKIYLTKKGLKKAISAGKKRAREILGHAADIDYGKRKWWAGEVQSYGRLSRSLPKNGKNLKSYQILEKHHVLPDALFRHGPDNTKGLRDYIPAVVSSKSEHLNVIHYNEVIDAGLNRVLKDKAGIDILKLGAKKGALSQAQVEKGIRVCKDYYKANGLGHIADAIGEFERKVYRPVR